MIDVFKLTEMSQRAALDSPFGLATTAIQTAANAPPMSALHEGIAPGPAPDHAERRHRELVAAVLTAGLLTSRPGQTVAHGAVSKWREVLEAMG